MENDRDDKAVKLHKDVLDGMVTSNGLFSAAVLIGVTGTVTPLSSGMPTHCTAGDDITHMFILFEVGAFGCYILSSLIALALKLDIVFYENTKTAGSNVKDNWDGGGRGVIYLRPLMFISVGFSLAGSFLVLLSIIELVQIKLGLYSCGDPAVVLPAIVIALLILSGVAVYAAYFYKFLVNVIKHFGAPR